MDRLNLEKGITILKPFCDALMKEPTVENATTIKECIKDISPTVIQDLFEYILYPITVHLQNDNVSKNVKEYLVDVVMTIISNARITKVTHFNKLYTCLLIQIYETNNSNRVIPWYEELKEKVLLCIQKLIHKSSTEVIESLYTRENAPKLSQGIYMCVSIARLEKSRKLRLIAIDTLMALTQVNDEADRNDIVLQAQVVDVVMLMLPGIASGLQEIATGNDVQGHKVTMMAVRAWGRIISLVMTDSDEDQNDDEPTVESLLQKNSQERGNVPKDPLHKSLRQEGVAGMKKFLETTKRSRDWLDAAAQKLGILIRNLNAVRTHSHHKVRLELAKSVGLLLIQCPRNMKPNFLDLIECLICLSEDDVEEVREEAQKALATVSTNYIRHGNIKPLIELLEESFYNVLTKLPRVIRRSDDGEQILCLNQVTGYLRLLGKERVPRLMESSAHMQRLLLALVYTIELDCSGISLLEEISVKDLDDAAYFRGTRAWKEFKFIRDERCADKILLVLQLLRELGNFRLFIDHLLELLQSSVRRRKEAILLLNWTIDYRDEDLQNLPIYKEIVDIYISEDFWYLPIRVSEDVPLYEAQSNVMQCCLLVEGLSLIAKSLSTEYDRFLLKTLYLIIERAGSAHGLMSYVGTRSLELIAKSQGRATIGELLRANVDYFSYHVMMRLRRVERNPGVLDVLAIVMRHSGIDVMPCLERIVEDALEQLNKTFQQSNSYAFLKVFHTFVICLRSLVALEKPRDIGETQENEVDEQTAEKIQTSSEKVMKSLLEYFEAKKVDEEIDRNIEDEELKGEDFSEKVEENDDERETNCADFQEEEKPEPPRHVRMLENVLKRCLHFVPSKLAQRSISAMLILQDGLPLLSEWEDILLPIIHQAWHPLVDRFREENVLLINRAWQLLLTLARLSKEFIRGRTLKQVWPALSKFLSNSAKESYNKDAGHAYKFTQSFRLQRELLSMLGQFSRNLKLLERDLWTVLSIAEPYLSSRQNPTLQECCVTLYKEIADYNEDIAWVKCLSIWSTKIERIPADESLNYETLQMAEISPPKEYHKNVARIIAYIQSKNKHVRMEE